MSKTQLKKFLNTLNHDQITEMVLELYAARKEAKDYLDYFMNPDEEKMQEKYRAIITKEFLPGPGRVKGRTSRCRKAIKEFATLHPHPSRIADLMLTTVESIMVYDRRVRWVKESQENAAANTLREALDTIWSNDMMPQFERRLFIIKEKSSGLRHSLRSRINDTFNDWHDTIK